MHRAVIGSAQERPGRAFGPGLVLSAVACIAPQLLGGVTAWTESTIIVLSATAATYTAWELRTHPAREGPVPLLVLSMMVAAAWTAAQLMSVPCGWVHPTQSHVIQQLAALEAAPGIQCSITSAPGSTVVALGRTWTQVALVLSALAVARSGQRRLLTNGIALSSVLMACVALAHAVAGAGSVFGLYAPIRARPGLLLAPLLNANHLAGHLALGFPICLHHAVAARRIDLRIGAGTACFVVFAAGVFTLSRGGILILCGELIAYLALLNARHPAQGSSRRWRITLAVAAAVGSLYLIADLLLREFVDLSSGIGKLSLIASFASMVTAAPLLGVGRGAFGYLSGTAVSLPGTHVRYPENILVQWSVEWGLVVTALLVGAICATALTLRVRSRSARALAIGVVALYAHDLLDYSLELPGIGAAAAIALGTVLGSARSDAAKPLEGSSLRGYPRFALPVASGVSLVAVALALPWLGRWSPGVLRAQLEPSITESEGAFDDQLSQALRYYPLDPALLLMSGARAVRQNDPRSLGRLSLAMLVAPTWAPPHEQAAFFLERIGRLSQAALEFGLSLGHGTTGIAPACDFLARHPSADLAWEIAMSAPREPARIAKDLAHCLSAGGHFDLSWDLLSRAVERFPLVPDAYEHLVDLALQRRASGSAVRIALLMRSRLPQAPETLAALMRALTADGQAEEALTAFDEAPPSTKRQRTVLRTATGVAVHLRKHKLLDELLSELFAMVNSDVEKAELHSFSAIQYERIGVSAKALAHLEIAYDLTGDPSSLERYHELATTAGLASAALRAAARLCHIRYHTDLYCNRLGTR